MINLPEHLRIFRHKIPVEINIPNPMRCFNCQKFGHHEDNCPANIGSVCETCGASEHAHLTSRCKSPPKCVNCGLGHLSRSSECEIWKKEKKNTQD